HGRELEAFDERAAFADGIFELERADGWKIFRDALHDAERVVAAAIKYDNELEFALVLLPEIARVITQHRFDTALFVIRGDQQQQTVFSHGRELTIELRNSKHQAGGNTGFQAPRALISGSTPAGCQISRCASAKWRV